MEKVDSKKTLTKMVNKCDNNIDAKTVNILFGPPSINTKDEIMVSSFLESKGKHIVCGGSTASLVSRYLKEDIIVSLNYESDDIPPIAKLEGVDLVTEGTMTISNVLEYTKKYLENILFYEKIKINEDGATLIFKFLFENEIINFFVGKAINPVHQLKDFPFNFEKKMNLIKELTNNLKKMGKEVKVDYY